MKRNEAKHLLYELINSKILDEGVSESLIELANAVCENTFEMCECDEEECYCEGCPYLAE